jgi:endonuclease/exonuclease/phosphatase family metal-dependent hydrolase
MRTHFSRRWPAACIAVALGLTGTAEAVARSAEPARRASTPAQTAPAPGTVTVMTRNLYLGANLLPIAVAQPGAPSQTAVAGALAHLKASQPAARMRLVAHEIAAAKPDLVGLQEVSVWRTEPSSQSPESGHVVADYLKTIMAELKRLHSPYRVVARRLSLDLHGPSSPTTTVDFQDGNAVLARTGVKVSQVHTADFRHLLTIPTSALGTVTVNRSWIQLHAEVNGASLRFVDTHLEAYSAATRLQQAQELVAGPLHTHEQTVLVGDLNSGPKLPSAADRKPFAALHAAGYVDERTSVPNCCLNDDLKTGKWDHIVDHVMARPKVTLVKSFITGRETTPQGLHPSDHGGLVSTLRLPAR